MKKSDLSKLLNDAKSDPGKIDQVADDLAQELSGYPVESWSYDDDGAAATKAEMKRACISLLIELERHGQPPSKRVVEMMEWAVGLRRRKQGNPRKPRKVEEREDALFVEANFQYGGHGPVGPPISGRKLAKEIRVTRATVRKWREDPDYLDEIASFIKEDIEDSME